MKYLFLLFVITSFYFLLVLKIPFYDSHDGEAHVARFASYYKAYLDGQFPARWAGDLNFRYGSPVFIFYYPLPGTVASIVHVFGISFENVFKILMFFGAVFSSLFFYLWISRLVKREAAFFASLLYGLAPYHFLNVYVRGDVAEVIAYMFVPLVFMSIDRYLSTKDKKYILIGGMLYALLIISHNAVSLMFSPVMFAYCFIKSTNKKVAFYCSLLLVIGLGLSAFFWVPALWEARFTNARIFIGDMYKDHFLSFGRLIYSEWGFGPDVNKSNGLSPQIGPFHVLLAVMGIVVFFKTRGKILLFWVTTFTGTLFLSLELSTYVWEHIPILKLFQFPWRFTGLSSFAASVLTAYVLNRFSQRILFLFTLFFLMSSVSFVKINGVSQKSDSFYFNYTGTTYYHGQASSIWTAGDASKFPKQNLEIIEGEGIINNIKRKSNRHIFSVNAKNNVRVRDNTTYFPGWQVFVDGKKVPIEFQDINHRGLITFAVPKGLHTVEVSFHESPIRFISNGISLVFFLIVVILVPIPFFKRA